MGQDSRFSNNAVVLEVLRKRAFALRWATVREDVIPLTAADPDFPVAREIREHLKSWIDEGYFSYGPPEGLPEFREAAAEMLRTRKQIRTATASQILATNSAASAMEIAARFMLEPGDDAIILDPVDFLFNRSIETAGGSSLRWPCDPSTGHVDFDLLSNLITPRTRMIGLCNPHNPVGKVWTAGELAQLADIAIRHDLWVLSDEIWSDIVFTPPHVALASLGPEIAAKTVTITGLSKTFGLAGCRIGLLHASSPDVVEGLLEASGARSTANGAATISQIAAIGAWTRGWDWADGFLTHLKQMRELVVERLRAINGVECRAPDGCYVAFPNIAGTGFDPELVARVLKERDGVAVVPGIPRWFGPGAKGHLRICFGTSHAILEEGLARLAHGFERGFGR